MSADSEHTILAGILQRPSRLADVARLDSEFFEHRVAKKLFGLIRGYHEKRGRKNSLDLPLARSLLEASNSDAAIKLLGLVGEYETFRPVSAAEFHEALVGLTEERKRTLIRDHGTAAVEAMIEGDYAAAKQRMRRGVVAADDTDLDDDAPVDIRSALDAKEEREIVRRPAEEVAPGFNVGFSRLTRAVSFRRRELTILGGYASDGKTHLSKTLVYNVVRNDKANALFVALEMDKRDMRVLFVAQHAATLDPRGVDYRSILDGNATREDRRLYLRALDDFQIDEHEDTEEMKTSQGSLYVWAPRKRIDMNRFCDRIRAMNQDVGLDVAVGDYLELIQPSRDLRQYRLNVKDMVEESKALAREEDLWLIQNHQISRGGRDAAEKRKPRHYLMRDLGETSGIERAADSIIWVFYDEDLEDDLEAKVGLAKAKKGKKIVQGFHVYANYARSIVAEIAE